MQVIFTELTDLSADKNEFPACRSCGNKELISVSIKISVQALQSFKLLVPTDDYFVCYSIYHFIWSIKIRPKRQLLRNSFN